MFSPFISVFFLPLGPKKQRSKKTNKINKYIIIIKKTPDLRLGYLTRTENKPEPDSPRTLSRTLPEPSFEKLGPDLFQKESLSLVTSTTRLELKWRTLWMMNGGWNKTLKTQVIFLTKKSNFYLCNSIFPLSNS